MTQIALSVQNLVDMVDCDVTCTDNVHTCCLGLQTLQLEGCHCNEGCGLQLIDPVARCYSKSQSDLPVVAASLQARAQTSTNPTVDSMARISSTARPPLRLPPSAPTQTSVCLQCEGLWV